MGSAIGEVTTGDNTIQQVTEENCVETSEWHRFDSVQAQVTEEQCDC